jgi:hypothetical protein
MRYVKTVRLMSARLGKEGDLLRVAEPIAASGRVVRALLASPDPEREACSTSP